ncbi:MAG: hypothetical protein HFI22_06075 [Lachnospiraceae bacterium]|nr:hypothetical protein [Lachnospiraceae bacterium]
MIRRICCLSTTQSTVPITGIRKNLQKGMILEKALGQAIEYCLKHGILADILRRNQAEVRSMLLEEYDEKAEREYLRKEAIEEGRKEGLEQGMEQGMEQGIELVIKNALTSTHSIPKTARLLMMPEEKVEKVAREHKIPAKKE